MKAGEAGVVAAMSLLLAGGFFVGLKDLPDRELLEGLPEPAPELSVYDLLKQSIQPYHFGNLPRESSRGDTTVWKVDLDHNMYTVPQVDLYVTRELRNLQFTRITAAEREQGGIVFNALFPNGAPIEIQFICP